MIRLAINGYGRIGRQLLRAWYEEAEHRERGLQIVAINSTSGPAASAHLTQYDSVHGRFPFPIDHDEEHLYIADERITLCNHRDPHQLVWGELGVDVVLECTGVFASKARAQAHIDVGAHKVLISAPGAPDVDATVVYGVNHDVLRADMTVVSNASCTTNCLAPAAQVLHQTVGIGSGLVTTVHAYTNDQVLIDAPHKDLRRARSATLNMIPTKTGAAQAVGLVLPELAGRLDGLAVRVPTSNVSLVDFCFEAERETSVEEINQVLSDASMGSLFGILAYNDKPLVSSDFNHHPAASIVDGTLTKVSQGHLVKVLAWYDNEWGFSNQMLRTAHAMMQMGILT